MNLVFIYGPAGAGELTVARETGNKLREAAARHDIFSPVPDRESLGADNTALAPEGVARLIAAHYHLPR